MDKIYHRRISRRSLTIYANKKKRKRQFSSLFLHFLLTIRTISQKERRKQRESEEESKESNEAEKSYHLNSPAPLERIGSKNARSPLSTRLDSADTVIEPRQ